MEPVTIAILVVAAFVTATISAYAGLAGGAALLVVLYALGFPPLVAVPLHAFIQLVSNGARTWAYRKDVAWKPLGLFVLASLPFPWLGVLLLEAIDPAVVAFLLGVLVLFVTWAPRLKAEGMADRPAFLSAGALGGLLGPVFGAAGPIMAPFLLRPDFRRETVIATMAVAAAWIHIVKIAAFGSFQLLPVSMLPSVLPVALTTIAGAYMGRYLLRRSPESAFRWVFKGLLSVLAIRLLLQPVLG